MVYLQPPGVDRTNEFICDPFSGDAGCATVPHRRLGAAICRMANIEFLDRIDHQVKIRGFRIELGEIENLLRAYSGVSEAVVVVQENLGTQRLVAYIVTSAESACRPGRIARLPQGELLDYMVPTTYVMLEKLPLTPNGKIIERHCRCRVT